MVSITPCRSLLSDRFPVASFVVQVPPERMFEIACTTDPSLLHPANKERRRSENFLSSAARGLLRAPAGQATYLMPPDDLRRFAGAKRLYYALGTYTSVDGQDPVFTVSPHDPRLAPSIQIAADFTGGHRRSAARAPASARYGAAAQARPRSLGWGGDAAAAPPPAGGPAAAYDDGFDPSLWQRPAAARGEPEPEAAPARVAPDLTHGAPAAAPPPAYEPPEDHFGSPLAASRRAPAAVAPAGYEDAPDLRRASTGRTAFGRVAGELGEPEGFEDAPHLARFGKRATAPSAAALEAPSLDDPFPADDKSGYDDDGGGAAGARSDEPRGRSGAYSNDYTSEELPETTASPASQTASIEKSAADRLHIIEVVADLETGDDKYAAINPDGEYNDPTSPHYHKTHVGLSWGFVQFAQRYGALGQVLDACRRRDQRAGTDFFSDVFGRTQVDELLRVTAAADEEGRLAPVAGAPLWDVPWLDRFRQAGAITVFQEAQREMADQIFFVPNLKLAAGLGINTPRALAMLYDRCVHMGPGGGASWVVKTVGPIRSRADRDAALKRLGFPSLAAFKTDAGLAGDDRWGPDVHAALVGRLRALGGGSPISLPTCAEMEKQLVLAARDEASRGGADWQAAADRLLALYTSDQLDDEPYADA